MHYLSISLYTLFGLKTYQRQAQAGACCLFSTSRQKNLSQKKMLETLLSYSRVNNLGLSRPRQLALMYYLLLVSTQVFRPGSRAHDNML
jgi:hypothetical protein